MNTTSSEQCEVTKFLVSAGHSLLQASSKQDWLDMAALADHCNQYGIKLHGHFLNPRLLEDTLRQFFSTKEEIYAGGLIAVGWERRIGWDLVFCVRFYRFNVPTDCDEVPAINNQGEQQPNNTITYEHQD